MDENSKKVSRQITKALLLSEAKRFLSENPNVVKHLNRKQRRKVADDLVKRLLKEARNDAA